MNFTILFVFYGNNFSKHRNREQNDKWKKNKERNGLIQTSYLFGFPRRFLKSRLLNVKALEVLFISFKISLLFLILYFALIHQVNVVWLVLVKWNQRSRFSISLYSWGHLFLCNTWLTKKMEFWLLSLSINITLQCSLFFLVSKDCTEQVKNKQIELPYSA